MRPEPSRVWQVVLPVVGASLGAFLFTAILPYVVPIGGPVLFVVAGILLPTSLAYLFHPSLYAGARLLRSRKAIAPAGLTALGAALGLASGPLGYLLLPPIWAFIGAIGIFRSSKPAA